MPILRLLSLPVRAPLLTVLFLVAVVLGNHWQMAQPSFTSLYGMSAAWFWCFVLLQVQVVVVFCTVPDLLLRQVSMLMASSRVMTLVVTLLVVITGGIYLLKLNVLTDVLILASWPQSPALIGRPTALVVDFAEQVEFARIDMTS